MPPMKPKRPKPRAVVTSAGRKRGIEIPAGGSGAPVAAGVLKMAVVTAEMTVHIHLSVILTDISYDTFYDSQAPARPPPAGPLPIPGRAVWVLLDAPRTIESSMQYIRVRGARTHNLKNLNLELPRERLIVVTGLSGSGKSSLTFDTLYAEGQRRYVESLSAYARQFLSTMDKPDVDSIEGLSPAIAIEQKANSHNPRSTVGTVTEIYDYLRLLYARAGIPRCPDHGIDLTAQTVSQMVDQVLKLPEGTAAVLLAPVVSERKGEQHELLEDLAGQGFVRVRIDGRIHEMDALPQLDAKKKHSIEAVVDRMRVRRRRCAAPGRIVRDGAAAVRRRGAARLPRCARARGAGVLQPSRLPGVRLQRADRWNRSCSPSTTPPAPAPAATASGCRNSSIRSAW